jgi:serine phosphatase RsbU (regulator of sigma subunit)/tRNA A-37 threonylcarbamoyl transferase component Bud32
MPGEKLIRLQDEEIEETVTLSRTQVNKIRWAHFILEWKEDCYLLALDETGKKRYKEGRQYRIQQLAVEPNKTYPVQAGDVIQRTDKTYKILVVDKPYYLLKEMKRRSVLLYVDTDSKSKVVAKIRPYPKDARLVQDILPFRRFERSARFLSRFRSLFLPRLISVDSITHYGALYQAQYFEYFDGKPLDRLVPFKEEEKLRVVMEIFHQVALGIQDLHKAGLVHRNLKPDHILVNENRQVKLVGLSVVKKKSDITEEKPIDGSEEKSLDGSEEGPLGDFEDEQDIRYPTEKYLDPAMTEEGEIVGDFRFVSVQVGDPWQKDLYSLATLFLYTYSYSEATRTALAHLPLPISPEIPETLKMLLERIFRLEKVTAAEVCEAFGNVLGFIQHDITRHIQYMLFPSMEDINIAGAEVGIWYEPLSELGGDFYDFVSLDEYQTGILIGDAVGHGLKAALYTYMIQPVARLFVLEKLTPSAILEKMDRLLYKEKGPLRYSAFATSLYGVLNLHKRQQYFMYAMAGHPPAILYRNGQANYLSLPGTNFGGTPLGTGQKNFETMENYLEMKSEDVLVLYTDGVTDVQNKKKCLRQLERSQEGVFFERIAGALDKQNAKLLAAFFNLLKPKLLVSQNLTLENMEANEWLVEDQDNGKQYLLEKEANSVLVYAREESYGDRLLESVARLGRQNLSASALVENLKKDLNAFREDCPLPDDITLIAIRIL